MKELNLQQLENLEGGRRRFWGWGSSGEMTPDSSCSSGVSVEETYYVLGIATGTRISCVEPGSC